MPKHRKRRIMLSIVSIVLFVVLSAQLSTFSFSVTAAGERGELVAEEYERYRERFDRIEKIGDLEDQGFRLLEDQIFAMPLQNFRRKPLIRQRNPGMKSGSMRHWIQGTTDWRYLSRMLPGRFCTRRTSWKQITAIWEKCGSR